MTRWLLVNLNRGELDGRRILQAASFDALWTRARKIEPNEWPVEIRIRLSRFMRMLDDGA